MSRFVKGEAVVYVDEEGKRHISLVIYAWETCLNIAYVSESEEDSYGNLIIRKTSVPFLQAGMSGNYILGILK